MTTSNLNDAKVKRVKKPKKQKLNCSAKPSRDFTSDLTQYICDWNNKISGSWKFSKVLQTWALLNCFDSKKIPKSLFRALLPYLQTVQGSARERLIEIAQAKLVQPEEANSAECNNETPKKLSVRATKIIEALK